MRSVDHEARASAPGSVAANSAAIARRLRCAVDDRALRPDRIHHGARVVHPGLAGPGQSAPRGRTGRCRAWSNRISRATEARRLHESGVRRDLPLDLEVGVPRDSCRRGRRGPSPTTWYAILRAVLGRRVADLRLIASSAAPLAYRCHGSGTPLSWCSPRSSKTRPEPATRSLTVELTRTSEGPARAPTRAPMWTAMPPTSAPSSSISPVWQPARTSRPSGFTASQIACAHFTARAGPSKVARKPSPMVLTSVPR